MKGDSQELAKRALTMALGPDVGIQSLDVPGAPPATPDFALRFADGREEPLEVTTLTDESLLGAQARVRGLKTVRCPQLDRNWNLYADRHFQVGKVKRKLCRLLADLLDTGVESFFGPTDYVTNPSVRALWAELGLEGGYVCSRPHSPPATIEIVYPSDGGVLHPAELLKAVAAEALKNRDKDWGSTDRRHLFLWVDEEAAYALWRMVVDGMVPDRPPDLPAEITTLWVGTRNYDASQILWRCEPPGPWEVIADRMPFSKN